MTLSAGTQLGPYEIVEPLGAGGMGEVYRGKDTRLDREVAIKVLPEHLAKDREALARFEREAKAVAALSHPNILAIHDVGTTLPASALAKGEQRGVSYVVMELLEGETLRERVRGTGIPWRKAVEIAVAIAEGLAAAHARGIVHRDLKPENVFLTTDGVVKILDFGLARFETVTTSEVQTDSPTMTVDTRPGAVLGTASYMSPEQVRGQKTDARSDIFSFGCVLYEMIAGRRAFSEDSLPETMTAILREEPPSVASSCAEVAPELDRVIAGCLEKKPEQRFHSAHDLAFTLRSILSDTGLPRPAPAYAGPRMRTMLGVQIGVGVVAVLALLVALNVGGWRERLFSRTPAGTINSLAVLPLANLSGDRDQEYFADGMTGELNTALGKIKALTVISRMSVMRYKGTDKTPPDIARELNVDALVEGTVARFGDRVRITANLIKGATSEQLWGDSYERELRDILALQNEVARAIAKEIKVKLTPQEQVRLTTTEQVNPEAYEAYLKGRYWWNKRTPEGLNRSLTLFRQAIDLDPSLALGYSGIADAYVVMGSWNVLRPHEAYPKAKTAATKGLKIDETLAEAHASLAAVAKNYDWDFSGAEREFIRAIQLNPGYATAHQWYAEHLAAMGRHEEAVAQMERALELDPLSLIIHVAYGRICYYARQYDLAIDHCHKALQLDPNFAPAHLLLSFSYVQKGMYEEAVAASQKAKVFSGSLPLSLASLGYTHAVAGNRDEALSVLAQLTELSKQTHVTADNLALIHIGLGEKDQAFGWLARAAEERSSYLASLNTEPVLDSLRSDPRFDDLVRRVGMEPAPRPFSTAKAPAGKRRLAVRPFNNLSANPEQEYFCDGMTEELISQLGRLHPEGLEVIGRGSSMHYKGSDKTSGQVGRELDVDYVLEGSVRRAGDRIRILAGLTQVSNQTQLWTEDYDNRSDADVFDIQADVARRIAHSLALQLLPDQQASLTKRPTAHPEAHQFYLLGRFHWNKRTEEGFHKAIELFQQAIAKDPGYALAYAGLADAYSLLSDWQFERPTETCPKARAAATKALELDSGLAEAHTALAAIQRRYDWDFRKAEASFERAIALNPEYATAQKGFALLLAELGRSNEAKRAIQRARQLDPLSCIINMNVGYVHYLAREYDSAIEACKKTLELDVTFHAAHYWMANAYTRQGKYDQAIAAVEKAISLGGRKPEYVAELGRVYATAGMEDEARRILEELNDRRQQDYVPPIVFANVYTALGEKESAFEWLERAYEQREDDLLELKMNPFYDPLRDDPRFDDLLRRIGFAPLPAPGEQGP